MITNELDETPNAETVQENLPASSGSTSDDDDDFKDAEDTTQ